MSVVLVSIDDDTGVATLAMNRPERLNALSLDLVDALIATLRDLAADPRCKAVVVTGSGAAFCAGADLHTFSEVHDQHRHLDTGHQVSEAMEQRFNPLMVALYTFPKPVISAVNGIAAGGGAGIALCADVVLCGVSGAFKFVQVPQLSIVADLGAHWFLQRIAGRAVAMAATLLGETLGSARAAALGLVWEVVPDTALLLQAQAIAARLATTPPDVVIATRALVDAAATSALPQSLETERLHQRHFCARPAFLASIEAFLGPRRRDAA